MYKHTSKVSLNLFNERSSSVRIFMASSSKKSKYLSKAFCKASTACTFSLC